MSIWTWSMKFRFQIGSNRPLAKRKARMFCAGSLPRKWSIRKIWLSLNVSCTVALSADGALQVGAEGLLHDHAGALDQAGRVERLDHGDGGPGRNAEIVQPADVLPEFAPRPARPPRRAPRALVLTHELQPGEEIVDLARDHLAGGEFVDRRPRELTERRARPIRQARSRQPAEPAPAPIRTAAPGRATTCAGRDRPSPRTAQRREEPHGHSAGRGGGRPPGRRCCPCYRRSEGSIMTARDPCCPSPRGQTARRTPSIQDRRQVGAHRLVIEADRHQGALLDDAQATIEAP